MNTGKTAINICMMTTEDISQVAAIEAASFSMPWSQQAFAESLAMPEAIFLTAETDDVVVGYIGCYLTAGEGEITNVAVAPTYRRRGIAETLLKEMLDELAKKEASQVFLEVREYNEAAIALYEKCGFARIGMRKNFYEKPREDAVIMVRGC